jgi:hypothetical protein
MTSTTLPFGRHRGQNLSTVPSSYLAWALRECKLSSGLRTAVAGELESRGAPVPEPPPREEPRCGRHPGAGYACLWGEDTLGRRYIRAECRQCHNSLGIMPQREPFVSQANAAASGTPVLDALVGAEASGVQLHSDGRRVWPSDYRKLPPAVRNAVRQANHTLARMIGPDGEEASRGRS